ncbi:MAG: hypothetical protein MZU97_26225 [Bacillus subtilis]|nr:hypothetical protein [Bacillus subtilis]
MLGSSATLCFETDGAKCTALVPGDQYLQSGHPVVFEVAIEHAHFFDPHTEQRIGRCLK